MAEDAKVPEAQTGEAGKGTEKKSKKLSKVFEGDILIITEGATGIVMRLDLAPMPDNVKVWATKHGFSQKLGDAAAGKEGKEAIEAIQKVYDGLLKGDLTVRAPATEKISKNSMLDLFNAMPEGKEKIVFKGLLLKLGVLKEGEPKKEEAKK